MAHGKPGSRDVAATHTFRVAAPALAAEAALPALPAQWLKDFSFIFPDECVRVMRGKAEPRDVLAGLVDSDGVSLAKVLLRSREAGRLKRGVGLHAYHHLHAAARRRSKGE